jgi:hypothetical protein
METLTEEKIEILLCAAVGSESHQHGVKHVLCMVVWAVSVQNGRPIQNLAAPNDTTNLILYFHNFTHFFLQYGPNIP